MKKRKILCLVLSGIMTVSLLAGCAKTPSPEDKTPEGDNTVVEKEILKVGSVGDITTFDPIAFTDLQTQLATTAIYSRLFKFDKDLNIINDLAEEYSNPSDLEWKIKIKSGVKFHDGTEVKAEDVKASIERAKGSSLIQHIVAQIEKIDVVDDYTVLIKTLVPFAPLLNNLADPCCSILPKALIDAGNDFNKNPIGSGPYTYVEWKPGEKAVFQRYEDYFNENERSQFKTLELKVIPEGTSRTIALETGDIDISTQVETVDYNRVKENTKLAIYEVPANQMYYFTTNNSKPPFDNKVLRQAMEYAIDKEAIRKVAQDGKGDILDSITPKSLLGYVPNTVYSYNPEKAKELLAQSGYVQGSEKLVLNTYGEMTTRMGQVIQSNLKDIGLNVEIETNVIGYHLEALGAGNYQMGISGWSTAPDPDRFLRPLYHKDSLNANNVCWYDNTEVSKMIDDAIAILDVNERAKMYTKIHETIMDDAAIVPLIGRMTIIAYNASLKNVVVDPIFGIEFNTIRY